MSTIPTSPVPQFQPTLPPTAPTTAAPQAAPAQQAPTEPTTPPAPAAPANPQETSNVRQFNTHEAPVVEVNFETNGAQATRRSQNTAQVQTGQGDARTVTVSAYGPGLYGNRTADGTRLTPNTVGVAHKSLPLGTRIEVTVNGRTVPARVIDRGPYVGNRQFDLTNGLIKQLGFANCTDFGVRQVQVRVLP